MSEYLVWSNEHKAWWGPNNAGYYTSLKSAGRYSREDALEICVGARGGRQFNENPTEVPILEADALVFWPDDIEEHRRERHEAKVRRQSERLRDYGFIDEDEEA